MGNLIRTLVLKNNFSGYIYHLPENLFFENLFPIIAKIAIVTGFSSEKNRKKFNNLDRLFCQINTLMFFVHDDFLLNIER